jgi:hypothetical protein
MVRDFAARRRKRWPIAVLVVQRYLSEFLTVKIAFQAVGGELRIDIDCC